MLGGRRFGRRLSLALAMIAREECEYDGCGSSAAALIVRANGDFAFVCAGHGRQAERLGYRVLRKETNGVRP